MGDTATSPTQLGMNFHLSKFKFGTSQEQQNPLL